MKEDIKEKWVKALRSGEYEQGQEHLKIRNKFCCLGVLCEIYRKETGLGNWVESNKSAIAFGFSIQDETSEGVPPLSIAEWAGLNSNNPIMLSHESLAEINDNGVNFNEIADLIEREL